MARSILSVFLFSLLTFAAVHASAVAAPKATFVSASEERFGDPHDLVISPDGKFLYVSDVYNDQVTVLDALSLQILGAIGKGHLSRPHDVAFDQRGRLLVADTGNDRVAIYEVAGAKGKLVGGVTKLSKPEGVAAGPRESIYVSTVGDHDVRQWRAARFVRIAGEYGEGVEQMIRPHDVDVDEQGRVYVSDPGNDRLHVLDAELQFRETIGGPKYNFNEPKYFAIAPDGWLFIADEYNHQIKILDENRTLVLTIGSGEAGKGPNRFDNPEGVEIRGENLWISDSDNNRIVLYRFTR